MRQRAILAGLILVFSPPAILLGQEEPRRLFRCATFNASLNRSAPRSLIRDLSTRDHPQAKNVAEIIQRVSPDVLLINEFDFDTDGRAAALFQENYLGKGQNGAAPVNYPFRFSAEVNTGVRSGHDLDNDGKVVSEPGKPGYGDDAFGFGLFPGQYGMVIYSKFPIERDSVVQFHRVLWKDMPSALLPSGPGGVPWYSTEELAELRLSSKSHWDVPIKVDGRVIHVLASHPTPPAFDGPEDRNGKRNHDEIRIWADYLSGGKAADYLRPPGVRSELHSPSTFVLMGDLNADPLDGGSVPGTMDQILKHPRVNATFVPRSAGAAEATRLQGLSNTKQNGEPSTDTADFPDDSVGNLRVDYVLPSKDLIVRGGGVFWPPLSDPLSRLVRMAPVASSDHRLVYLDLALPPER